MYVRRLNGDGPPWTDDRILQGHRFTNTYRAADRVSQYLIRHVLYEASQADSEIVVRTLLFRFFNKVATWELLTAEEGPPTARRFDIHLLTRLLDHAVESGIRIYSSAYIIPPPSRFGALRKHRNHLELLVYMLREGVVARLQACRSLGDMFRVLRSYPSLGDFLAYQLAIDLNYSESFRFDEAEFVAAGPGAREGIRKCFRTTGDYNDEDVIRWVAETQGVHFARLGLHFPSLWGRPLQLIDVQNVFCEVGKYSRISHPEFTPTGGRTRIKQRYRPAGDLPKPFFPPRWGINAAIIESLRHREGIPTATGISGGSIRPA
jgi:hypothetical protein